MTNDLLTAVDALTKPTRRKIIQEVAPGETKTVTLTDAPLLDQLDRAISSSMGGNSRGATLKSEGAILNSQALWEAIKISDLIRDWCHLAGIQSRRKDSAGDLRTWYVSTLTQPMDGDAIAYRVKVLRRWATQIGSMLNPVKEAQLMRPCPACGQDDFWKDGQLYQHPMVRQHRADDEGDLLNAVVITCRSCGEEWGRDEWKLRSFVYDLEQADTLNTASPNAAQV